MHKWFRLQLILLLVSITSFATYAFASFDTNISPNRGEGAAAISGWTISNVHYRLVENTSRISAVEFDLDGPASQVAISFDTTSDRTFNCFNVDRHHWLCQVDGVEIAQINQLRVISVG